MEDEQYENLKKLHDLVTILGKSNEYYSIGGTIYYKGKSILEPLPDTKTTIGNLDVQLYKNINKEDIDPIVDNKEKESTDEFISKLNVYVMRIEIKKAMESIFNSALRVYEAEINDILCRGSASDIKKLYDVIKKVS